MKKYGMYVIVMYLTKAWIQLAALLIERRDTKVK